MIYRSITNPVLVAGQKMLMIKMGIVSAGHHKRNNIIIHFPEFDDGKGGMREPEMNGEHGIGDIENAA